MQIAQTLQLVIDEEKCHLCNRCLAAKACRGMAFVRFDREETPVIDEASCRHCFVCVPACPFGAVVPR